MCLCGEIFKHNLKNIIRFQQERSRAWDLVESELSLKPRDICVLLAAEGRRFCTGELLLTFEWKTSSQQLKTMASALEQFVNNVRQLSAQGTAVYTVRERADERIRELTSLMLKAVSAIAC